jgi:hypothetical protein
VNGFRSGGLAGVDAAFGFDETQAWVRLLTPHYVRTTTVFGRRSADNLGLKRLTPVSFKQEGAAAGAAGAAGAAFGVIDFELAVAEWIRTEGLKKAKTIVGTSKKELRGLIARLEGEGLGVEAIGRDLRKAAPTLSAQRARTIARTETHNAATWANQEVARSTGLELVKFWLAHPGPRTRPDHWAANDQQRHLDEPYDVGFAQLMRPGDSSLGAGPEQTIECRCGEAIEPIEE